MTVTVRARGFLFPHDRRPLDDPEDYNDYIGARFDLMDFRAMLEYGSVPVGLIVQGEQGGEVSALAVVVREGDALEVRPL